MRVLVLQFAKSLHSQTLIIMVTINNSVSRRVSTAIKIFTN